MAIPPVGEQTLKYWLYPEKGNLKKKKKMDSMRGLKHHKQYLPDTQLPQT